MSTRGHIRCAGLFTANTSFFYIPTTFVVGYNLTTRCEHNFTVGGRPECENGFGQGNCSVQWDKCNGGGSYWSSTLDWAHTPNEAVNGTFPDSATGLAVQRSGGGGAGMLLAVAHAYRTIANLRLFDKVRSWGDELRVPLFCGRLMIALRRSPEPVSATIRSPNL